MTEIASQFSIAIEQRTGFLLRVQFDQDQYEDLYLDEPPPLGEDEGPNAARVLAAAIGSCLSASLLFCMKRRGRVVEGLTADVHVDVVRNEAKRLRIGAVRVVLRPPVAESDEVLAACRDVFEDFCTVTASIRSGIAVDVEVAPKGP